MEIKLAIHPHPILRRKSKAIARVDKDFKSIVRGMFDIMYAAKGVGLAANQVGIPIRLFVANPTGIRDDGPEFVFINPVLSRQKGIEEIQEGCLSLPGVTATVKRPKSVWVNAYDQNGKEIDAEFIGFMSRIIQHETDHLDGVLFIDRLPIEEARSLAMTLENLESSHLSQQSIGAMSSDIDLLELAAKWEKQYC